MVLQAFPAGLFELASSFNENESASIENNDKNIMDENEQWLKLGNVATKNAINIEISIK